MRFKFTILFSMFIMLLCWRTNAQVTSSSMTGFVKDENNKGVPGAIVRAVHLPSGTTYGTATESDGSFNIQNMRVGGPYTVEISFVGYEGKKYENIYLTLGEIYQLNARLVVGQTLQEVSVKGRRDPVLNNQRTGAATDISEYQINTLPTVTRSISDFTRLSPYAGSSIGNGTGGGTNTYTANTFGGRNALYNNVQINGANFNNAFGLSQGLLPGGAAQPISLDAIDEIQVAVAPFDVRQAGFTGANINAVTRSGTNEFTGSVYEYWRNQNFEGVHVGSQDLPPLVSQSNNVIGARLGGPIIKNKLFFFVNYENEKSSQPGLSPQYSANGSGGPGTISKTSVDSLQSVSYWANKARYNTDAYQGYYNQFTQQDNKILARLDWNISNKNKFDIIFSNMTNTNPVMTNGTSAAGGALSNQRVGPNSLSFANSIYGFKDVVTSVSAELVTNFTNHLSNQVLGSFSKIRDTRTSPSADWPFVDISRPDGYSDNQISLGYELFTYKNDVKNNDYAIYDNLTYSKGRHNITAGASFQELTFGNSFLPYGTGYYRYGSVAAFDTAMSQYAAGAQQTVHPTAFGYTYAYPGETSYVTVNYGLVGVYLQDKYNVTDKLTLTGGLRMDVPMYLNKLTDNPHIDTMNLLNAQGQYTHYNSSAWPKVRPVLSPRIAFNWNPKGDRSIQVRGGTGIFMGAVPFVWFTNQAGNIGTLTNQQQITNGSLLSKIVFNQNPALAYAGLSDSLKKQYFSQTPGSAIPGQIALVDPNFRMPTIWRSDLGADIKLPFGLVGTVEFIYTHDIQSVYYYNANLPNAQTTDSFYNDNRPAWTNNRLYNQVSGAYVLTNAKGLGYQYSGSIGIMRPAQKGFYGSIYYTGTYSSEVSSDPGSQPNSTWNGMPNTSSPNTIYVGPSEYFVPHRIIGTISYRYEYLKHLASTLTLLYEGASPGRFSYVYSRDVNGDGVTQDLIYIPTASDITKMNFVPVYDSKKEVLFSAQQQQQAFEAYIDQDKYLSKHRGQLAQPYGAKYPFYNRLDLRFLQDIFTNIGKRQGTLQFSIDMFNFPNLINPNWGVENDLLQVGGGGGVDRILVIPNTPRVSAPPAYQLATYVDAHGNTQLATKTFIPVVGPGSTWSMQLGLRFIF